jgi:hypothetical protein
LKYDRKWFHALDYEFTKCILCCFTDTSHLWW